MKKDSKGWIDERAPKHLSSSVLSGALYIHTGKDADEKIERTDQVLKKIGPELASYAMALLVLPQMMDMMRESQAYKEFADKLQSHTVH
jgi:hypothetical protein